jgi:nucleoside-diphosphate-sugar epimerase
MLNVLVTGATGFVGLHLIKYLKLDGYNIKAISRKLIPSVDTVICDFLKDDIPDNALKGIDIVFHLAGYAHDLKSESGIEQTYQKINVNVTADLLSLSAKHKVKKFIFVSSVKAGGNPIRGKCAAEEDQNDPAGIYGETKREAELKILETGRKSGIHVSVLRPALIYGPKVKGNLQLMMQGIKKGWFPPLPETGNRRSMIHVDDVVQALLLLASDYRSTNGEIFIVTDGRTYSSRDIYEIMCSTLGKRIPRWTVPQFLFNVIASINPRLRYRIDKLLGDECYSSKKIQSIGFKAKKTLKDMYEADF